MSYDGNLRLAKLPKMWKNQCWLFIENFENIAQNQHGLINYVHIKLTEKDVVDQGMNKWPVTEKIF